MTVTAVSPVAISGDKLRRMVSLSPTFQAAVGVDNPTDALDSIYIEGADENATRPFASILPGTQGRYRVVSSGSRNFMMPGGSLLVYF